MPINKAIICQGQIRQVRSSTFHHQYPHIAPNIKDSKWVSVTAFNSLYYKVLKIAQLSNDPKSKAQSKTKKHFL